MLSLACLIFAAVVSQTNETLRTLAQVSALPFESFAGRRFDLTGQALALFDINKGHVVLHDSTGNFEVRGTGLQAADIGAIVRVRGMTRIERVTDIPFLESESCERIGMAPPAPPKTVRISDTRNLPGAFQHFRTTGTVFEVSADDVDPKWQFLTLRDDSSFIYVALLDADGAFRRQAESMVDAQVEVCGFLTTRRSAHRRFIGPLLAVPDASCITVVNPAPADPFELPELTETDHFRPDAISELQRRTVEGHAIAVWGKDSFLLSDRRGQILRVKLKDNSAPPRLGDRVKVVGFPQTDLYNINISQALVKRLKQGNFTFPDPKPTSARNIFLGSGGEKKIKPLYHGRLIRIRGEIRSLSDAIPGERIIHLDSDGILVPVDVSASPDGLDGLSVGCTVEATGVCVLDAPNWSNGRMFPSIDGMILVPRDAADIRLISRPPWWTTARLLGVIGGLLAVLVGILIWNVSLRRLAERRGRELYRSEIEKAGAELRISERTRLAVELHDSIAQNLTGAFFQVEAADLARESDPSALAHCLKSAMQTIQSCREELRYCLWDLRNNVLDESDAADVLRRTLAPHVGAANLSIDAKLPRPRISDNTFHTLLRIARELVSNAVRHGRAKNIAVTARFDRSALVLTVADDGIGFDPTNRPGTDEGHFGLQGIEDRIRKMSGHLILESTPGKGTRVTVNFTPEQQEQA